MVQKAEDQRKKTERLNQKPKKPNGFEKSKGLNQKPKKADKEVDKDNDVEEDNDKDNDIDFNKLKSIYPSHHINKENKNLNDMMDKTDKIEFEKIIYNSEIHLLNPNLAIEITEILKEMYMNPETKEKVKEINSKKLLYALKKFAIANTKTKIQIPKQYFKKCILSALQQTELSEQFDTNTMYEKESEIDEFY